MAQKIGRDPFGFTSLFERKRGERPDNFRGDLGCPFCTFSEKEGLVWEDEEAFIVKNKYPPVECAYVLVSKLHSLREEEFLPLFGRMISVTLEKIEGWCGGEGFPLVFRNKGPLSGASIEHDHGQFLLVDEIFYKEEELASFLKSLPKELRIREGIYAYPYPIREYELLCVFDEFSESEWRLFGRAVDVVYSIYRKGLNSHNIVLFLSKKGIFKPFAVFLPRPNPISGIELLSRVSVVSLAPEEVVEELKERI